MPSRITLVSFNLTGARSRARARAREKERGGEYPPYPARTTNQCNYPTGISLFFTGVPAFMLIPRPQQRWKHYINRREREREREKKLRFIAMETFKAFERLVPLLFLFFLSLLGGIVLSRGN